MKWVETNYRSDLMLELKSECSFFMEYMWDIVEQLIQWKIWLRVFDMIYEDEYQRAKIDSKRIDVAYENWNMWRLAIVEGGPDYISYFDDERQRCLDILRDKGILLNVC